MQLLWTMKTITDNANITYNAITESANISENDYYRQCNTLLEVSLLTVQNIAENANYYQQCKKILLAVITDSAKYY